MKLKKSRLTNQDLQIKETGIVYEY